MSVCRAIARQGSPNFTGSVLACLASHRSDGSHKVGVFYSAHTCFNAAAGTNAVADPLRTTALCVSGSLSEVQTGDDILKPCTPAYSMEKLVFCVSCSLNVHDPSTLWRVADCQVLINNTFVYTSIIQQIPLHSTIHYSLRPISAKHVRTNSFAFTCGAERLAICCGAGATACTLLAESNAG